MAEKDDLLRFVHDALGRGVPRAEVQAILVKAGWDRSRVASALAAFADVEFPLPVPRPRPYLSAREAFLYLLLFTTLYMSAFNLGSLLFALIDRQFADAAEIPQAAAATRAAIRWSISAIVVAFPVFLFLSRLTSREMRSDPARRGSLVRRWLTYLTLFVSAGFLIGDVIALVYNALGGELTVRFGLKVAVIGVIAGSAFGYYLSDLRSEERESS
jgi:hypothetical protein